MTKHTQREELETREELWERAYRAGAGVDTLLATLDDAREHLIDTLCLLLWSKPWALLKAENSTARLRAIARFMRYIDALSEKRASEAVQAFGEKVLKLKRTEWQQLLSYIEDRERDGWYYGNKAQFEKRHEHIKSVITSLMEKEV